MARIRLSETRKAALRATKYLRKRKDEKQTRILRLMETGRCVTHSGTSKQVPSKTITTKLTIGMLIATISGTTSIAAIFG